MESEKKGSRGLIAVVLAAGLGTRMKSSLPKVLHRLCGKSLIKRASELLQKLPLERKIVVVGSHADLIRKELPEDFEFAIQDKPLGTAHAVLSVKSLLSGWTGDVLILCADTPLLTFETIEKFIQKHQQGHYCGTVLTGRLTNPTGYGRIVRKNSGEEIAKIVEENDATIYEKATEEINSGTYCFQWPVLSEALGDLQLHQDKNELYLTDVVQVMTLNKQPVGAYCVEDSKEILGINSRVQLAESEKILRSRVLDRWMKNGVTIIDPSSTFIDESVRLGEDTTIYPFTMIEGEATIGKGCSIGPFTHIRGKTVLEDYSELGNFVEVKASRVGLKSKAKHLTYLGDTTIGQGVNIGAGTITANYDGQKKYPTQIEDGAFIGSGTIMVAPVRIGKKAITGAGAVVTRGKDVPDGETVVGVPAKPFKKIKSGNNL